MSANPLDNADPIRVPHSEAQPFSPDQVRKILEAANSLPPHAEMVGRQTISRERARGLCLLALYTGFRISDITAFERSRINPGGRLSIRVMKSGKPLLLKVPQEVIGALWDVPPECGDEKHFFWAEGRNDWDTAVQMNRNVFYDVFRRAGVDDAYPHRFRDTFACRLLAAGVPIRRVQLLLGHSSVVTTERHYAAYVREDRDAFDRAVDLLDFG